MIIGISTVELFLPGITSLKEKRRIINSIKAKIRKQFNVSISEIDYLDKWQRAQIGIAAISNDSRFLDSLLKKTLDIIKYKRNVNIIDYKVDINNGFKTKKGKHFDFTNSI